MSFLNQSTTSLMASSRRIVVVGSTGCCKAQLGSKLAKILNRKFENLDDINWLPNWEPCIGDELFDRIKQKLPYEKWVVSSTFNTAHDYIWPVVDMLIWIDLPLHCCLWGTFKKQFMDLLLRKKCGNGSYETLNRLIGNNSRLYWVWKTHPLRRQCYREYFGPYYHTGRVIQLTSYAEIERFLYTVSIGILNES